MNESDTNLDVMPESAIRALQEEVQSLRTLIIGLLLVLILLSGAFNLFLLRQAHLVSTQATETKKMVEEYQANLPGIFEFWNKLGDFAKTHPDFKPIMDKYSPFFQIPPKAAPVQKK
jgi:hypothetical protein